MRSFAAGIVCALVLAGVAYVGLRTGTVTMVEKSDDRSTALEGVLSSGPGGMAGPAPADSQGG